MDRRCDVDAGAVLMTREGDLRFRCRTEDGVELSGIHLLGPKGAVGQGGSAAPDLGKGPAFVIGHGFSHGVHKPATMAVMATFAEHGGVSAADFRGHGRSSGRSSVGRDETRDLDAVVRWTRARGFAPITVVGFSMGAAVAIRHAAIGRSPGDAVVAVSSPSRWYVRESVLMRRLHWLLEHPFGPLIGRAIGVRLGDPWFDLPASPVEAIADIIRPVLVVHGTADPYFGPAHARVLRRASRGADLWVEPGMGHGETASTTDLIDRIAHWSGATRSISAGRGTEDG